MRQIQISNEDYHNGAELCDYWSSSNLKHMLSTPKKAHFEKYNREHKQSAALIFGSNMHEFLESKALGVDFWDTHEVGEQLKKNGEPYAVLNDACFAYYEVNPNHVSSTNAAKIKGIWENLEKSKLIRKMLRLGDPEITIIDDERKSKVRLDLRLKNQIVDWKTIRPDHFNEQGIIRAIENYNYDFSAAMYQEHDYKHTGIGKQFLWVFIENEAPFDFVVVDATQYIFDYSDGVIIDNCGAKAYSRAMKQYLQCKESGLWGGMNSLIEPDFYGERVLKIAPTPWHHKELNVIYES